MGSHNVLTTQMINLLRENHCELQTPDSISHVILQCQTFIRFQALLYEIPCPIAGASELSVHHAKTQFKSVTFLNRELTTEARTESLVPFVVSDTRLGETVLVETDRGEVVFKEAAVIRAEAAEAIFLYLKVCKCKTFLRCGKLVVIGVKKE